MREVVGRGAAASQTLLVDPGDEVAAARVEVEVLVLVLAVAGVEADLHARADLVPGVLF